MNPLDELTGPHGPGGPAPGRHLAQLYTEDEVLVRVVADFAIVGLGHGEGVVLIATPEHRAAITGRLDDQGFSPDTLARRRQLIMLDAGETLAALRLGRGPVAARFETVIGGAVRAGRRAGFERLRVFGEMLDLLHRRTLQAALETEALWSDLVATHDLTLLCGYEIDALDPGTYRGLLQRVCAAHSHLVPVEDCASLDHAVECAYLDVFGARHDAAILRRLFLAHYPRPAAMPDAQAAILAAHEFVPEAASTLLDRIRHYYRLARAAA
jgi:hypothetical protein